MGRLKAVQDVVVLVLLLLLAGPVWAEVCKGSKVPKAYLAPHDAPSGPARFVLGWPLCTWDLAVVRI